MNSVIIFLFQFRICSVNGYKVNVYTFMFSVSFTKGNNFCNSIPVCILDYEALVEWCLLSEERICFYGCKVFTLRGDFKGDQNQNGILFALKVWSGGN